MKKLVLLSVVASSVVMAGGDIVPVEPIVEAPMVEKEHWHFSGQAVAYTQTVDAHGTGDLFSGDTTYGSLGLQLRAVNKDLFSGVGVGLEASGIEQSSSYSSIPSSLYQVGNTVYSDQNRFKFPFVGGGDAQIESGAITQAYFTYGFHEIHTSLKIGRQTLPKDLSPFAYSEGWQVFKNTIDTALIVNTSLPHTTLIYGAMGAANSSIGSLSNFEQINRNGDGLHMITAQTKAIENVKLTGTFYYAPDFLLGTKHYGDTTVLWGDAHYHGNGFGIGLQGGQISTDNIGDTTAFGAKIAAKLGMVHLFAAYSSADGDARITNFATTQMPRPGIGIKSPFFTQMVLNNIGNHQAQDSDWGVIHADAKLFGGKIITAYGQAMDNNSNEAGQTGSAFGQNPSEFDLMYKRKVGEHTTLFAAYVYTDRDRETPTADGSEEDSNNFVRFWARYNF